MTDSKVCNVCYDTYTTTLRKCVTCPYCSYKACMVCSKRYLIEGLLDAHCMSCRRGWNDEFLDLHFTKTFRTGEYRRHREKVLVDREISILPSRQVRVEAMYKHREFEEKKKGLTKEFVELDLKRRELLERNAVFHAGSERYKAISEGREPPAWSLRNGEKPTQEKSKFIMKCPDGECRGFLSSSYKCGTCQMWACNECLVIKGEDKDAPHTCDPGTKETVALIVKESRGCPKCGERISKIDGCDQMWCTECKTAFSWITGNVVTGVVHNPHYYEYLRKMGNGEAPRNEGDIPCGGIPGYHVMSRQIRTLSRPVAVTITNIHRLTAEIDDFRLRAYQRQYDAEDNGDLAVKYLMKEITMEEMKHELAKRETKRNKHLAIRAILEMFVTTCTILLQRFIAMDVKGDADIETLMLEFNNLRDYVNVSLSNVSRMKSCSVPHIGDTWNWITFYKAPSKGRKKVEVEVVDSGSDA